jgi:hypothetical protein
MKSIDRPTQITTILKTIGSGDDAAIRAELETYIAALEAKQADRPAHITAILKTLESQYPADMSIILEAYLYKLEIGQQLVLLWDSITPAKDTKSPVWSNEQSVQREQHRRERALKKQNNYQ